MEGNLHGRINLADSSHGASIRTMSGNQFACVELDVCQETLVSLDEYARVELGVSVEQSIGD